MKAVPGRKSDVRDAEWIVQLFEHGPLAPSFVRPAHPAAADADPLPGPAEGRPDPGGHPAGAEPEDASIKLSSVASSLRTVSARAILRAMVDDLATSAALLLYMQGATLPA